MQIWWAQFLVIIRKCLLTHCSSGSRSLEQKYEYRWHSCSFHNNNQEGIHALMCLFNDRETPASLRNIDAFSGYTYKFTKPVSVRSLDTVWCWLVCRMDHAITWKSTWRQIKGSRTSQKKRQLGLHEQIRIITFKISSKLLKGRTTQAGRHTFKSWLNNKQRRIVGISLIWQKFGHTKIILFALLGNLV